MKLAVIIFWFIMGGFTGIIIMQSDVSLPIACYVFLGLAFVVLIATTYYVHKETRSDDIL